MSRTLRIMASMLEVYHENLWHENAKQVERRQPIDLLQPPRLSLAGRASDGVVFLLTSAPGIPSLARPANNQMLHCVSFAGSSLILTCRMADTLPHSREGSMTGKRTIN